MATYAIKAPDGHTIELQGPPGASHDDVIAMAQKLYKPNAPSPHGAIAGEPDLGDAGNSLLAGGIHFVHQLPLVGDAAITAGRWANDQLNGRQTSWAQANDEAHQTINSAQQQHPVASTVGGIAGGADAALIGGGAAKAAGVAAPAALALKAGQPLLNAGRLVASGAAAGGALGAAQGGGQELAAGNVLAAPGAALQGGAEGAIAGGLTGGLVSGAAGVAGAVRTMLPGKTALALSKVFGESASDLQAAWGHFQDTAGRPPSMAELATLKQRGAITSAAKGSGPITEALSGRADQAALDRSTSMRENIGSLDTQGSGAALNARTAQGDVDYAASRAAPDFNIPTEPSDDLGGVSPSDHLSGEILPQAGLGKSDRIRIQAALQDGKLSSQDAQLIRSGLGKSQERSYSPATSGFQTDFEQMLGGHGNDAPNAALDTATSNFSANSSVAEGAKAGEGILGGDTAANFAANAAAKPNANANFAQGQAAGTASKLTDEAATPSGSLSLANRFATDDSLYAKMKVALGPANAATLRDMGATEAQAALNLAPFKGKAPEMDDATAGAGKRVFQGILAGVSHGPFAVYHAVKALGLPGLSPQVQEKVAQYLADPRMVQQGINLLRKAGATSAQMRQLSLQAAHNAGSVAGGLAAGGVQ